MNLQPLLISLTPSTDRTTNKLDDILQAAIIHKASTDTATGIIKATFLAR